MKLFLSWSGSKSHAVALILQKYLPSLINQVAPWLSSSGIDSGARWSAEIAANLEASNVGVICVAPENRNEPWILFEAGAIAKLTTVGRAMVLRIGLASSDITGPLAQFQSVTIDRDGIRKLVMDINKSMEEPLTEKSLELSFNIFWPNIEAELKKIASQFPVPEVKPRSTEDMLSELLELGRRQEATLQNLIPNVSQLVPLMSSGGPSGYGSLYGSLDSTLATPYDRLTLLTKPLTASNIQIFQAKESKPVDKT